MAHETTSPLEMTVAERERVEPMIRQGTNRQWRVTRAKIVLKAANGQSLRQIAGEVGLTRNTVRLWRKRWPETAAKRSAQAIEAEGPQTLRAQIERSWRDEYRSGGPVKFRAEPVLHMVAISCEDVTTSSYPVSHWTPKEVGAEAVKRGIVTRISLRPVGRFLK